MAKNKTDFTAEDVYSFIEKIQNEERRKGSLELIKLMESVSGEKAKMWGATIVGFGNYHYKYESGHEGNAPLIGFAPRKSAFSLYVFTGLDEHRFLLEQLGRYTMGKTCIYVKKVQDINQEVLAHVMKNSIDYLSKKYKRVINE